MPFSYATTIASGLTAAVVVPFPFIDRVHVHVTINGTQLDDGSWTWVDDGHLNLNSTPNSGDVVRVFRATPADQIVTQFSDPAILTSKDLNAGLTQMLYIVQESTDGSAQAIEVTQTILDIFAQITALAEQAATSEANAAEQVTLATAQVALATAAVASIQQSIATTGVTRLVLYSTSPSGWVMFNDGTIGDASSGASRANSDTQPLFNLLYASPFTDSTCPLVTSTGSATTRSAQGTAAQAYSAHCRLALPKTLGRALAVAGAGSGLTSRTLGAVVGEEAHALIAGENGPHIHGVFAGVETHTHLFDNRSGGVGGGTTVSGNVSVGNTISTSASATGLTVRDAASGGGTANQTATQGSGTSHNTMQPTAFLNLEVKL